MRTTRRAFGAQLSSAGALALACASSLFAESQSSVSTSDLISRMKWMNEPEWSRVSGGQITVRSKSKTDFWRKTFYGYVTDNGHFFHLPVNGDFTFEARIGGKYHDQYDQAGIMVRLDAENWMKCGTELVDGVRHASVVFTREFSDWSTMNDLSSDSPVWWRAVRKRDSLETLCSFDGQKYQSVRQGYVAPGRPAEVGIMCASPEGKGFEATFENFRLSLD
jgi:regulation of enolase protein 1 (concanavalin A-like superfamily)